MDITTTYLGLNLRSPLVPSAAAPLSEDLDNIKRLEDAGAGAVVLHSLFEEQLLREKFELHHHLEYGTESFAEALTYFPEPDEFHVGPELYLDHIQQAKQAVQIPIIASLNGFSSGGWVEYAKLIQDAGADAIELNIYYVPTDFNMSGAQVEQNYIDTLREVKAEVSIPVTVKLSPFFSNLANMAKQLDEAGADGLALFNRFLQPDINPEELEVEPGSILSHAQDLRLPMRWIAILYGRINADLAATSGVQRGRDALKLLMSGAKVTHVCSALLRHGIPYIQVMEQEMKHWMEDHEYESVKQMQGSMSQLHCEDKSAYERAQYMKAITSYQPERSLI
ncbi:dihydroorotate dehydrogenase-like protein [Limnoraphis robusta Tam1]|uniref:Dihydroorotate dehydrogenase-like protein n=1 Tax=Limnoraphis robusta CCNP1315 TaxID=3110306 RepID=A0ABU5U4Y4_9CYAN|nr:dihydroorotate dehydrogenase-like protein [Limnoraphis robusta]MEA5500042.1 dihydroorotate dehydrogenase-like protein [Limnoraphis robusta BA-68 BA1]MEA5521188.1 dihydroorotate dehydrogenase-like protein [Limnoraphis robusta CCNP1315]MEA5537931.1 dihydroorotate dehydrogenase-like protein [Limnoraphis robusta Tam1]MEA5546662.1 dihydroorotate dehydrogenase-like protein [Limnoraphis robusta CCNP1324]